MEQELIDLIKTAECYQKSLPPKPLVSDLDKPFASYLDYALHKPDATPMMIEQMCAEAVKYRFATVFTNPLFIPLVKRSLEGCDVNVGSIAGFPLGAFPTKIKMEEARSYIEMGADEIDMVMAVGMLKAGDFQFVLSDIRQVAEVVHGHGKLIKVILETALLTRYEKIMACLISKAAGADFVKTSTGFSKGGATVDDVDLMRRVVGPPEEMGVKAAGGIHSLEEALAMIKAGANRIGAGSAVRIIQEYQERNGNISI
jgi:deoxyribose-phosphate aldolase